MNDYTEEQHDEVDQKDDIEETRYDTTGPIM
jgi:hypothetical protein